MEEVKIVVLDTGRVMALFDDGTMMPLIPFSNGGVFVDYCPSKKETNYA